MIFENDDSSCIFETNSTRIARVEPRIGRAANQYSSDVSRGRRAPALDKWAPINQAARLHSIVSEPIAGPPELASLEYLNDHRDRVACLVRLSSLSPACHPSRCVGHASAEVFQSEGAAMKDELDGRDLRPHFTLLRGGPFSLQRPARRHSSSSESRWGSFVRSSERKRRRRRRRKEKEKERKREWNWPLQTSRRTSSGSMEMLDGQLLDAGERGQLGGHRIKPLSRLYLIQLREDLHPS